MRRRYLALYRLGLTPWDKTEVPQPLTKALDAGGRAAGAHAVDLGCGTGRQALYLADHGWSVTAVDYVADAIKTARKQDPHGQVDWRIADVTEPASVDPDSHLAEKVALVLDNGCLHGIAETHRAGWARTVDAIAARGCVLLVRAAPRRRCGIGPSGIGADELTSLLGVGWRQEASPAPGWYRYTRRLM